MEFDAYENEITVDFRKFYNISVHDIGRGVSITEALSLLVMLNKDTASHYFAKKAGWKFAASREYLVMADTFDAIVMSNVDPKHKSRVKPYTRPWPESSEVLRGTPMNIKRAKEMYKINRTTLTQDEIIVHNRKFVEENKGVTNGKK